jgi:hypothetical protein
MHTPLTYIDISHIADHLGCRDDIIWFHQSGHHDPDNPCPEADAYLKNTDSTVAPLWLAARTQEWEEWNDRRKFLAKRGPDHPGTVWRPPEDTEPEEHP